MVIVRKSARNIELLTRNMRGETLAGLQKEICPDISYARVVDIVANEKNRIFDLLENGHDLGQLQTEYGLKVEEINSVVSQVSVKRTEQKLRWEAENTRKTIEYELAAEIVHTEKDNGSWCPISLCPTHLLVCLLWDGSSIVIGSRIKPTGSWYSYGEQIDPTHWMPLPAPPVLDQVEKHHANP